MISVDSYYWLLYKVCTKTTTFIAKLKESDINKITVKWVKNSKKWILHMLLSHWHDQYKKYWSKQNEDRLKAMQEYSYVLHWIRDSKNS